MNDIIFHLHLKDDKLIKLANIILQNIARIDSEGSKKLHSEFIIIEMDENFDEVIHHLLFNDNKLLIVAEYEKYFNYLYKLSNKFSFHLFYKDKLTKSEDFMMALNIFKNSSDKLNQTKNKLEDLEEKMFDLAFATTNMLEKNEQMEELVKRDGLTSLFNHSYFKDKLNKEFSIAKAHKTFFTISILDLDFFKFVNDKYGHLKGDEVLKMFGKCISDTVKDDSFAARYGGEEFALIFFNKNSSESMNILLKIKECFGECKFISGDDRFSVTFSAGVAEYNDRFIDTNEMLHCADNALYDSKRKGRNCITICSPQN